MRIERMRSARKTLNNNWYGTSRLLARTFKSSSIQAGSRSEIVAVDGFRLGRLTFRLSSQVPPNKRRDDGLSQAGG